MDIHERDRLWSKYYLTNEGYDNFSSLHDFVLKEAKLFLLEDGWTKLKAKKIIRNMLKALPKEEIINRYSFRFPNNIMNVSNMKLSKRIIINNILRLT